MTSNRTDDPATTPDLLLPERSVLLHIGPHKTGTTALQGALHNGRSAMAERGVVYAGRERQHQLAALGLNNTRGLAGDAPPDRRHWERLVKQVNAAADRRVIVSSEFFNGLAEPLVREVVESLGGRRVQVVVTLRPLAKILPSAWQQHVRNRLEVGYDEWLDGLFNRPPYDWPTKSFWKRHHHDRLIEKWAGVVGPERLTVVIVDQREQDGLMRMFERLVGLPDGLLVPDAHVNRSLTYAETEAIRHLNIALRERRVSGKRYKDLVRMGVIANLQLGYQPGADEAPISTPQWALDRAGKIGSAAAARIEASGVRVIGDLSSLGRVPTSAETNMAGPAIPVQAAVAAVVGAIDAGKVPEVKTEARPAAMSATPVDLNDVRASELAGTLLRRVKQRVKALVGRTTTRGRR